MRRMARVAGLWLAALATGAGCGSSSSGPPQIVVTSPQSGTAVQLPASNTAEVKFNVSNFNLRPAGTCNTATNCGQVYADIDNGTCDQTGKMYNAIAPTASNGSTSAVTVDFSLCPASSFAGSHTITLSLHLDSGATVIGAGNSPAMAQITMTTTGGSVTPSQVDAGAH